MSITGFERNPKIEMIRHQIIMMRIISTEGYSVGNIYSFDYCPIVSTTNMRCIYSNDENGDDQQSEFFDPFSRLKNEIESISCFQMFGNGYQNSDCGFHWYEL